MTVLMGYFANDLITKKLEEYNNEEMEEAKSSYQKKSMQDDLEVEPLTGPSSLKTRND